MQYLQRLPLIFALAAAILSGMIGFIRSMQQKDILVQMVVGMVIFYITGLFVRTPLIDIREQIDEKRRKEEEEERKKQMEKEAEKRENKEEPLGQNIDFTAGDIEEDTFQPLPVSEFIRKELKGTNAVKHSN